MDILKHRVSLRLPEDVKVLLESLIMLKASKSDKPVRASTVILDCIRYGAKFLEQDLRSDISIPNQTLPESQRLVLVAKQIFEKHFADQPGEAA